MTETNRTAPPISSTAAELIAQIEEVIGLAAGTFFCPDTEKEEHRQILFDASDIISDFVRISDPGMRQRCVEFVRAARTMTEAQQSTPT